MYDDIPPIADPVPAIVTLIPRDDAWERWVLRRLGPRVLPWRRLPHYRRAGSALPPKPVAWRFPRLHAAAKRVPIVH